MGYSLWGRTESDTTEATECAHAHARTYTHAQWGKNADSTYPDQLGRTLK